MTALEVTILNEFQRLLVANAAFTPPARVVKGVPNSIVTVRPAGAPHSIAEELWHIVADLFLRWARCGPLHYQAGPRWVGETRHDQAAGVGPISCSI